MRIHYLQHVSFENPGSILEWAESHRFPVTATLLYKNEALPELNEFDWLIVMGGPMNIDEESDYPWLKAEKQFLKKAIDSGKVVIGMCLGSQLIAAVIGGKVVQNTQKEIGWFPITFSEKAKALPLFAFFPENPMVFHWHGDTFIDLPAEAVMIAASKACQNQAFIYKKRVFGFQFHLENNGSIINDLIKNCSDEMIPGDYVQSPEAVLAHPEYITQDNRWMAAFLNQLQQLTENGII
ncbi:type 1 glutamine amidotransferase [Acetobacterium woodii]|uniref:Putative amidotransferase n=1 Tax=Acetobacterium woodii (strain ATCC 29683 / DSM 1030 / JCM 2381 / KCTC 1655 / WB1) TaxID=931626 RepID=H6LI68_ACEWD|nr:type 1 glutamine amidotransferase [Acetobacterium woodii]AFA49768.1 putative amidotransferase [Acetobacterium woodii DSM 1030]